MKKNIQSTKVQSTKTKSAKKAQSTLSQTQPKTASTKTPTKSKLSRRGVASLYICIFAAILFGIITLSFMRIILSEAGQSSDDDLSRSAYDSALAGVEDAKTAVNRYYECLRTTGGTGSDCNTEAHDKLFQTNCESGIGLAKFLYNYSDGEIAIQQNAINGGTNPDNNSDQAYTCVIIKDTVPDYRSTLTSDTRTKVIPLGVYDGSNTTTSIGNVHRVRFSWYSSLNEGDASNFNFSDGTFNDRTNATVPPTIYLSLIRVGSDITTSSFHTANNGTDYASVALLPTASGGTNEITSSQLMTAGNAGKDDKNTPFLINCSTTSEFACSIDFTNLTFDDQDSVFLVATLPYGDTVSDFAVTLYSSNDISSSIDFTGVQISVDSTGRTNQLVRRVEARLDPADLFFPYPEFEIETTGNGDETLSKNFWITANCWHSHGGPSNVCNNNGDL